jgi:hypothetical protein
VRRKVLPIRVRSDIWLPQSSSFETHSARSAPKAACPSQDLARFTN